MQYTLSGVNQENLFMKSYNQKFISEYPLEAYPTGEIAGFPVSPGMFDLNGATPLENGVNLSLIHI